MTSGWRLAGIAAAAGFCMVTLPMLAPGSNDDETKPNGKGIGTLFNPGNGNGGAKSAGRGKPGGNIISYHGGPLILGTVNVYYIWYGDWAGNPATTILTDFITNIGGSPYYNINTTYHNGSNVPLSNSVFLAGSTYTPSTAHGKSLSDTDIRTIVMDAINGHQLPLDNNAVYFVLTSADVTATSGFCTKYCGWHTYGTITGLTTRIKYAFVGDPTRCPSSCMEQSIGPNGASGADGMASVIAHELEEAASDPELNAWYDGSGAENADKCAWTFGSTYPAANGALANIKLGARDYLIQQNWVNSGNGFCAQSH